MVRSKTALIALLLVATATRVAMPRAAVASTSKWHPPEVSQGKAFPVLLPADGRWLNWRNTYGAPRMRLVGGTWQQVGIHQGIDVFAERGSPIVSITAGTVENVGWTFYSGYRVGVRGTDGAYYFYAHMLPTFAKGIAAGARVLAGQTLGYLGSSGYGPEGTAEEFPPHLHFGLQRSGWVNPDAMLVDLYRKAVQAAIGRTNTIASHRALERTLKGRLYSPIPVPGGMLIEQARSARAKAIDIEADGVSSG